MCSLTEILAGSTVAGPLVRLSCRAIDRVQTGIGQSFFAPLLGLLIKPILALGQQRLVQLGVRILFLLNLLALLCGLCILDTGPIGLMTWSLLALGMLEMILRQDINWLRELTVVDLLVLAFLASAAVSAGFSSYLKYSVIGFAKLSTFAAGYFGFRVLSVLYASSSSSGNSWIYGVYGLGLLLSFLGLLESLIGFGQFFNHVDARATWVDPTINPELNLTRIFGTLKPANPNLLAGFLIPCLVAAIGIAKWRLSALLDVVNASSNRAQVLPRLLFLLLSVGASVAILGALVLTGSRGGFLAIAGILLVLFALWGHLLWQPESELQKTNPALNKQLFSRRTLKTLWVLVLVFSIAGALGVLSVSPQLQHRVSSIFAMRKDSSISYRLNVYNSVGQMIQDNPVVGIGPGNDTFKRVYGYYMVPGFNALGAYSVPLEILAEQGVVGFGIFVLLLLVLCLRGLYFLDSDRPLSEKMTVIILVAGIVASILYGVFDTIWYRPSVNLLFWLFVALLAQLTRPLETTFSQVGPVALSGKSNLSDKSEGLLI